MVLIRLVNTEFTGVGRLRAWAWRTMAPLMKSISVGLRLKISCSILETLAAVASQTASTLESGSS